MEIQLLSTDAIRIDYEKRIEDLTETEWKIAQLDSDFCENEIEPLEGLIRDTRNYIKSQQSEKRNIIEYETGSCFHTKAYMDLKDMKEICEKYYDENGKEIEEAIQKQWELSEKLESSILKAQQTEEAMEGAASVSISTVPVLGDIKDVQEAKNTAKYKVYLRKIWIDEKININKYIGETKDTVRKIKNGELYSYEYVTPDGQRIKVRDIDDVPKNEAVYGKSIGESGRSFIKSSELVFGSSTKSTQKLMNQMKNRGWTEDLIRNTVDNPYTSRTSVNKATGNEATVFYTQQGSYVIVDNITKEIVQISDNINPSTWAPDSSIVDPYIPD